MWVLFLSLGDALLTLFTVFAITEVYKRGMNVGVCALLGYGIITGITVFVYTEIVLGAFA